MTSHSLRNKDSWNQCFLHANATDYADIPGFIFSFLAFREEQPLLTAENLRQFTLSDHLLPAKRNQSSLGKKIPAGSFPSLNLWRNI